MRRRTHSLGCRRYSRALPRQSARPQPRTAACKAWDRRGPQREIAVAYLVTAQVAQPTGWVGWGVANGGWAQATGGATSCVPTARKHRTPAPNACIAAPVVRARVHAPPRTPHPTPPPPDVPPCRI
eukprot:scaffold9376_cov85-Isochrysis_galbana.AAC.3